MIPTCPNCNDPLVPIVAPHDTPPWKCTHCLMGWWNAELTLEARQAWHPEIEDFHWSAGIAQSCHAERMLAHLRGTSTTIEHLDHLTPKQRATAQSFAHPRAIQFHDAVDAARQESS